jgi:PTS system nitrogen regulatory IIA component
MIINRILNQDLTLCKIQANSKKRALENIAELINQQNPDIDADELFKQLIARERLGSTAIGQGIAIPHCRYSQLESSIACLITLKDPINFDAQDDYLVDVLFVLIVPENSTEEHLNTLSEIATLMSQSEYRNRLRKSQTNEELYNAAISFEKAA